MFVLWACNMSGPRTQSTVSRLVLLLLLLLSGLTRTVLCQEEYPDPDTESHEAEESEMTEGEEEAPEGETTDPSENGLDTTPVTVTNDPEYGANGEERGSGRSLDVGEEPLESTTNGMGATPSPMDEGLDLLLIAIPVALVFPIIAIIVGGIFIYRRLSSQNRLSEMRKEDPFLEGSSTEKVPMPMFEEDVPSVLELEMDQLDGWMKKDGETIELNQQA